jgi:short-subunit dehydrogenase
MTSNTETVLITGASSGIGAELATQFAKRGFDLVLVARSRDKLQALAKKLRDAHGVDTHVEVQDLAKSGAASALARRLDDRGTEIDILVNNAGVLEQGAFSELPVDAQLKMVNLNVNALTDMTARFLPGMLERGHGRILNVASIAGFMPVIGLATYAATKAYVLSLSESLSEELRGTGVTVTAVCPGLTDTDMVSGMQASNRKLSRLPRPLVGDPADVAKTAREACLKGAPVSVPGVLNQGTVSLTRTTPRWLLRRIAGTLGRQTL